MKTRLMAGRGALTAPWARRYAAIRASRYSEHTERGCVALDQPQQAANTEWLGARHALRLVFDLLGGAHVVAANDPKVMLWQILCKISPALPWYAVEAKR